MNEIEIDFIYVNEYLGVTGVRKYAIFQIADWYWGIEEWIYAHLS